MRHGHLGRAAQSLLRRREFWIGVAVILTAVSYWGISDRPGRQLADQSRGEPRFIDLRDSTPAPVLTTQRPRQLSFEPLPAAHLAAGDDRRAHAVILAVEPAERSENLDSDGVRPATWEVVAPTSPPAWLTGEIEIIDE